ncbi:MAG: DUF1294 domain-containing protein [Candidatus Magasanikbacteria bacterium]|jgi:uncharacterized membrane protein YsdA (DUF1294 family)|nr:DUF1294 domain-containing protein [Candidatus Magasanikbacteria bacterium]MBT4220915.1 DUF1294 domain-containing protein [Candidatus Magasanikbacteria bacterium]MBT4350206.1 DUF1294 domain-containing protein [Candidatus Magasanikbacteria bacterium]MBT4541878.1 DUF1294 domain-containing protein [Candidatus Magasanikbacteria bacterium]MBT6252831.1 DUF1294 domain-containing protein [Candidatus Magasanikbacteria bacterium]
MPAPFSWFLSLPFFTQLLLVYIICITFVTFFCFGIDKLKAQLSSRRISEKTLWALSLLGGSLGAILGMSFFRHKTKKVSFQFGFALILLVQILLLILLVQ